MSSWRCPARSVGVCCSTMAVYDRQYGGYRIFVGDLGAKICRYDLEKEFEKHGRIADIWMARNPPGFAFIVYKYADDAEKAVSVMEFKTVCGRRIRVEHARPYSKAEKSKSSRHSRMEHYRGRSYTAKRRGRHPHRRSFSRSRSRSRTRTTRKSSPRRGFYHHKSFLADYPGSKDRERYRHRSGSKGRDRRRSNSKDRLLRERKRSHSQDNDRWKRRRSEDSSDDERSYGVSEVKNKAKEESEKQEAGEENETKKVVEETEVRKEVSLCTELEVDENMLASITLPPEEKPIPATEEKEEKEEKEEVQEVDSKKAVQETKFSPGWKPVVKAVDDTKPEDDNAEKEEGTRVQTYMEKATEMKEEEANSVDKSTQRENEDEDVCETTDDGRKKVKTCTVHTQTDFSHLEQRATYHPPDTKKNKTERRTKEIATDTNFDEESTRSQGTQFQSDVTRLHSARIVINKQPSKDCICSESFNKQLMEQMDTCTNGDPLDQNDKCKSPSSIRKCAISGRDCLVDDLHGQKAKMEENVDAKNNWTVNTGSDLNDGVSSIDKNKKLEYMEPSKNHVNGQVKDCFSESLIKPKVSRKVANTSSNWTAGIVLSEQTAKILSNSENGSFGIKAM